MTALLEVENLATYFFTKVGVVRAVNDVSFSLARGEILGLVGESGSGKTVTGFSILGLIDSPGRIISGSIRLAGRELVGLVDDRLREIRGRQIAMIFQDPMMTLNPVLSIGTQMRLAIHAHESVTKRAAQARSAEMLTRVGISDAASRLDTYPHQYSGGMRQRVAIAIALLHRPSVIIADEPTTALDVCVQAQILSEMKSIVAEFGTSMIWITHDLAVVSALSTRIAVMYAGRIVEEGTTSEVLARPRHPYTLGLLNSLPSRAPPHTELKQIPGAAPSPLNLPEGCPFRPRCSVATSICTIIPPLLADAGHLARCHNPLLVAAPDSA
jgi:peptide/nickel transport system ATP-binding protein